MDGTGFLWTIEDVAGSIFSHQSHIKWTSGLLTVGRDFCFKESCKCMGMFKTGLCQPTPWHSLGKELAGWAKQSKQENIITDRSALLMSYPIALQPVGKLLSPLNSSLSISWPLQPIIPLAFTRRSSLLVCMTCHKVHLLVVYSVIWVRKQSLVVSRNLLDGLYPAVLSLQWISGWLKNPMRTRAAPICLQKSSSTCTFQSGSLELYLPPLALAHNISLVSSCILWHSFMHHRCFLTWRARPIAPLCILSFLQSLNLFIAEL